ncbi:hypothetical protein K7432_013882 [Basidiobolus ranarum]|uniref:G-patch domain-containing protein n=1 Tax=Basidiobolus ranarum TaxID=34480 RepID=A0ABR2WII6_9FUNG
MSLYDDLPAPATNEESKPIVANTKPENGWTPRFLQPVIRRPPVNKVKPTRSVGSVLTSSTAVVAKSEPSVTTSTPTPNSTLTTSTPLFKPLTIASKVRQPVENTSVNTVGTWSQSEYHQKKNFKKRFGNSWEDEYDPQVPNDYEKWKLERKKPRQASVGSSEEERENNELNEKSSVHHYTPPKPSPANVNLKLSGEEAYLQRAKLSQNPPVITPQQEEHSQGSGEQFAKKMLKQYGWSEGQGLGKYAQGINTPLTVERVAPGFGIILNTATNQVADPVPIPVPELKPESELERPSTVVLLTNMVDTLSFISFILTLILTSPP